MAASDLNALNDLKIHEIQRKKKKENQGEERKKTIAKENKNVKKCSVKHDLNECKTEKEKNVLFFFFYASCMINEKSC